MPSNPANADAPDPGSADVGAPDSIAAALAGDVDRYREIVLRHEPQIWRQAAFVLRDRAAAEDLTQEVFLVAYRKLDEYDPARPIGAWLAGIARNLLRNELRRRGRETARLEAYARLTAPAEAAADDPADAADRKRFAAALAACRQTLADAAADAIRLRYDLGLDVARVAEGVGRSTAATRQLLYRARHTLRECVERRIAAGGAE